MPASPFSGLSASAETTPTSARNRFAGRIGAAVAGAINTEVRLDLPGGDTLVAVVTTASAQALGLAVGGRAVALVKAPWVMVAVGGGGVSAHNRLAGVVTAVSSGGGINAEVAITLAGGSTVHAVVTQEAVAELGLAPGVPACAIFQPSQIVLAV